ncbi:MAG: cytidine/deoxycytidylate deaminase family protein [Clostridiales bacterium]|jgi:dCMP deaminase|nr:cytidine/deoxycytidylate deaminase family protein [Clostridiales bacterium]
MSRISWDEYFIGIAYLCAKRSTCLRRQIGAVIAVDNQIISTGYNGACSKLDECTDIGCLRNELNIPSGERHEICRAVHAEQNAIIQAAVRGVSLNGGTLYCTHSPCVLCAKMIINAKIKRCVISEHYSENKYVELFKQAGIEIFYIEKPNEESKTV